MVSYYDNRLQFNDFELREITETADDVIVSEYVNFQACLFINQDDESIGLDTRLHVEWGYETHKTDGDLISAWWDKSIMFKEKLCMKIKDFQRITIEGIEYYILLLKIFKTYLVLEKLENTGDFIVNAITESIRSLYHGISLSGKFSVEYNENKEIEEIISLHKFLIGQVYASEQVLGMIRSKNDLYTLFD